MAKLRDIAITIVPKVDSRKLSMASQKIGLAMKKGIGSMSKIGGGASRVLTGLNQGLEVLEKIKNVVSKTAGLVTGMIDSGDAIADLASAGNLTAGQLMSLRAGFSGGVERNADGSFKSFGAGASAESVDDAFRKFLQKAATDDRVIEGGGLSSADYFVSAIQDIAKERDLNRRNDLIDEYFGSRSLVGLQDLLAQSGNFHKNKLSLQEQASLTSAIEDAERVSSQKGTAKLFYTMENFKTIFEKGLTDSDLLIEIQKLQKDANALKGTHVEAMVEANTLVFKIEEILQKVMEKGIEKSVDLVKALSEFSQSMKNLGYFIGRLTGKKSTPEGTTYE